LTPDSAVLGWEKIGWKTPLWLGTFGPAELWDDEGDADRDVEEGVHGSRAAQRAGAT
jgi:hypothetical protein